jgi:hypothetical protein
MKRSSGPRKTANLSESVHQQLNMYALAASAAGVGILALAQPSQAKIVYTPAHKVIPMCAGNPQLCFRLDLNHDHIVDFTIPWSWFSGDGKNAYFLIRPAKYKSKNEIWGEQLYTSGQRAFGFGASALPSGVSIGPNSFKFQPKQYLWMWGRNDACGKSSAGCTFGQWKHVKNEYLGLKFYIKGKVHYGWARLNTNYQGRPYIATLTGYAYETIPNKPIITGQTKEPDVVTLDPGSLGALAAGALAK